MAVPKKKKSKAKGRSHQAAAWRSGPAASQRVPALPGVEDAARRLPQLRLVQGAPSGRGRLT